MNEFRVCNKCRGTNIDTLIPKLKELDSDANIIIGCQNFCGIGARKPFVICNHKPIVADTEEELIIKLREVLSK